MAGWDRVIEKKVAKYPLNDASAALRDLAFWLSKSPAERISAVQKLRQQQSNGTRARLQRVARITQLIKEITNENLHEPVDFGRPTGKEVSS